MMWPDFQTVDIQTYNGERVLEAMFSEVMTRWVPVAFPLVFAQIDNPTSASPPDFDAFVSATAVASWQKLYDEWMTPALEMLWTMHFLEAVGHVLLEPDSLRASGDFDIDPGFPPPPYESPAQRHQRRVRSKGDIARILAEDAENARLAEEYNVNISDYVNRVVHAAGNLPTEEEVKQGVIGGRRNPIMDLYWRGFWGPQNNPWPTRQTSIIDESNYPHLVTETFARAMRQDPGLIRAATMTVDKMGWSRHEMQAYIGSNTLSTTGPARLRDLVVGEYSGKDSRRRTKDRKDELPVDTVDYWKRLYSRPAEVMYAPSLSEFPDIAKSQASGVINHALFTAIAKWTPEDEKLDKVWVSHLDHRTRPTHFIADGQRVPFDEKFLVGGHQLMYPGEFGAPTDEVRNCRCRFGTLLHSDPMPNEKLRSKTAKDEVAYRRAVGQVRAREDPAGLGYHLSSDMKTATLLPPPPYETAGEVQAMPKRSHGRRLKWEGPQVAEPIIDADISRGVDYDWSYSGFDRNKGPMRAGARAAQAEGYEGLSSQPPTPEPIYRGYVLRSSDLPKPIEEMTGQEIVDYLKSHEEVVLGKPLGTGLGRHWSSKHSLAEEVTYQPRKGDVRVVVTADRPPGEFAPGPLKAEHEIVIPHGTKIDVRGVAVSTEKTGPLEPKFIEPPAPRWSVSPLEAFRADAEGIPRDPRLGSRGSLPPDAVRALETEGKELVARAVHNPPTKSVIWRGAQLSPGAFEALTTAQQVSLPLSSFTGSEEIARAFGGDPRDAWRVDWESHDVPPDSRGVIYRLERGAKVADIEPVGGSAPEHVAFGQFRVDKVEPPQPIEYPVHYMYEVKPEDMAAEGGIRIEHDPESNIWSVIHRGESPPVVTLKQVSMVEQAVEDARAGTFALVADGEQLEEIDDMENYRTFTDAVIAFVGTPTSDGRMLARDIKLSFRTFPLPLMWCKQSTEGHMDSYTVGVIESAELRDDTVVASGYLLNTPEADDAADQLAHGVTRPSVDLAAASWTTTDPEGNEITEDNYTEGMTALMTITEAELIGTTLVATPAFGDTSLPLGLDRESRDISLVAAAAAEFRPRVYDHRLFENPNLPGPTLPTLGDDGRVYGHLACFGECHRSIQNECVIAPRSRTGYSHFHTSPAVRLDTGERLPVGRLTVGTGHAPARLRPLAAAAHYDNTGTCWALVRVGEDSHGIWFSGVPAPWATPEQIEQGLSSPLSGDWRDFGQGLELVAALSVNTPGFRASGRSDEQGRPIALVASLGPVPDELGTGGDFRTLSTVVTHAVRDAIAQTRREEEQAALAAERAALLEQAAAITVPPTPNEEIAALLADRLA